MCECGLIDGVEWCNGCRWVYIDEFSPELNDLLANTPTLTDEDIEELGDAIRWLDLPWWKRLFMKPND